MFLLSASIINNQNEAKLHLSWPLCPSRMPALHPGFGARGSFRPQRSGPDQAHHLPEAPVPQPRKQHFEQHEASLRLSCNLLTWVTSYKDTRWQAAK